jgi:DNA-directed RNA polymerase subunit M/transcription elongation factor TFIIS
MPISCECPECGKRLKAADSAAGKKAKCPDCGAAVPIPALKPKKKAPAADDDEFDLQKLNIDAGLEGPVEEDLVPCPMCGEMIKPAATKCRYCGEDLKRARKKKGKRAGSGDGMPVTVIVAVCIEVLFMLFNVAGIVMQLIDSNIGGAAGSFVRLGIEVRILTGYFQRKSSSRTSAIALSAVGLVLMFVCGGLVLFFAAQIPQVKAQVPENLMTVIIGVLVLQILMYIIQIAVLLTSSARDYLSE